MCPSNFFLSNFLLCPNWYVFSEGSKSRETWRQQRTDLGNLWFELSVPQFLVTQIKCGDCPVTLCYALWQDTRFVSTFLFCCFLFVSLALVWPSFYSERPQGLRQPGSFYCEEEELRDRLTHAEGGREGGSDCVRHCLAARCSINAPHTWQRSSAS